MPSKAGSQRRTSGPNTGGASSIRLKYDYPNEEACDVGSRGVSTPHNQRKVSGGIIPVSLSMINPRLKSVCDDQLINVFIVAD